MVSTIKSKSTLLNKIASNHYIVCLIHYTSLLQIKLATNSLVSTFHWPISSHHASVNVDTLPFPFTDRRQYLRGPSTPVSPKRPTDKVIAADIVIKFLDARNATHQAEYRARWLRNYYTLPRRARGYGIPLALQFFPFLTVFEIVARLQPHSTHRPPPRICHTACDDRVLDRQYILYPRPYYSNHSRHLN